MKMKSYVLRAAQSLRAFAVRFAKEEDGQDLVEYVLIVAAIGLALIATVNQFSAAVVSLYQSLTTGLGSIGAGGQ